MDEFTIKEPANAPAAREMPTDLTKEEYSRFYVEFAKITGPLRLRKVLLTVALLFAAAMAALLIYEWVALHVFDPVSTVLSLVLTLVAVALWGVVPYVVKRHAQKQYDQAIDGGYCYAGVVRICGDRVEKQTAQGTTAVELNARALFIETPEMMVFYTAGQPSIVLPARYLTPEAATALREAADKLPYRNRRFGGRVVPGGELPAPAVETPQVVLWEREMQYDTDEMVSLFRLSVKTNFLRRLPMLTMLCLCFSLLYISDGMSLAQLLVAFLLMFAALLLFNLLLPLRRAKGMAQMADARMRTVTVKLTDRGVWVKAYTNGFSVLAWSTVEHVINRDSYVEITRKWQSVRIPKRYIDDLAAFDTLISGVWKKTNSK